MRPIRIDHEVERLAQLDQFVGETFGPLEVNVVVAGAVDDQQLAFQSFGERTPLSAHAAPFGAGVPRLSTLAITRARAMTIAIAAATRRVDRMTTSWRSVA